jgi:hypothetical protein
MSCQACAMMPAGLIESLRRHNNSLHANIWRLSRQKTVDSSQLIDQMRRQIESNTRRMREIHYLQCANRDLWERTVAYIQQLREHCPDQPEEKLKYKTYCLRNTDKTQYVYAKMIKEWFSTSNINQPPFDIWQS